MPKGSIFPQTKGQVLGARKTMKNLMEIKQSNVDNGKKNYLSAGTRLVSHPKR